MEPDSFSYYSAMKDESFVEKFKYFPTHHKDRYPEYDISSEKLKELSETIKKIDFSKIKSTSYKKLSINGTVPFHGVILYKSKDISDPKNQFVLTHKDQLLKVKYERSGMYHFYDTDASPMPAYNCLIVTTSKET